jgi:ring-1,2-phenylacetyl-CoA epoxidase subunit PaaB
MDTQWPRYQVFVQEKDGAPFLDYGSVHAPDAELALLNARDVFARRPEAVCMWVVPERAIYTRTAEQLSAQAAQEPGESAPSEAQTHWYHIFCKPRPAGNHTQLGMVEAQTAPDAVRAALAVFAHDRPPSVWWAFPAEAVTSSQPADLDSLYAPAHDKGFRLSTEFRTHSAMRQLKKGAQ